MNTAKANTHKWGSTQNAGRDDEAGEVEAEDIAVRSVTNASAAATAPNAPVRTVLAAIADAPTTITDDALFTTT